MLFVKMLVFNRNYWFLAVFTGVLALSSCKKEKEDPIVTLNENEQQVFVLNEGNYQSANASISIYKPEDNTTSHNIFQANNSGRPLGDVVQSMEKIGDNYFIVVNNSSKIEVVSSKTFRSVGKISGLNSPRFILPINATKAYVSDLYADQLYVINPQSLSVSKTIPTLGWTEQMALVDGKAFVCQVDSAQVLVFDVKNDTLLKKISTKLQPQSIVVDINDKVWVAASGGLGQGLSGIHRINTNSLTVEETFEVNDLSKSIGGLSISSDKTKLYYLMEDVFTLSINASGLPQQALINSNGRLIYCLGVDPNTNDIYISDAIDYLQQGVIYRYDSKGREQTVFKAGIIPGSFYFY